MKLFFLLCLVIELVCKRYADVLFLTDIHIDILYDSSSQTTTACRNIKDPFNVTINEKDFGRYDCDSPVSLFNSMFSSLKSNYNNLDLIILNGDQIGHDLYSIDLGDKSKNRQLYHDSFSFIYKVLKTGYPEATILPVIGNNDFYEHYSTPDESSKKEQINFFKSLYFSSENINKTNLNPDFEETVNDSMYYSYRIDDTKFIMLNSVIYTLKNKNFNLADCDRELEWFVKELKSPGKKLICLHVPPYPFFWANKTEFFFRQEYMKKFDDLMYEYRDSIINVLSSHLHWMKFGIRVKSEFTNFLFRNSNLPETDMDRFIDTVVRSKKILNRSKQIKMNKIKYFNLINLASLSPIFSNSPTYSILQYDIDNHRINNIRTYSGDLNRTLLHNEPLQWDIQYDLKKDFKFQNFNSEDIYDFVYHRVEQPEIKRLLPYYIGGYPRFNVFYMKQIIKEGIIDVDDDYKKFLCAYKEIFRQEIELCEDL
jgi:hypothetical protein